MAEIPTAAAVKLLKFAGVQRIDAEGKKAIAEIVETILNNSFKKLAILLKEGKRKTATADMLNALAPEFEEIDEEVILKVAPVLRIAKSAGIERVDSEGKEIIGEVATRIVLNEFFILADVMESMGKQTATEKMLKALVE